MLALQFMNGVQMKIFRALALFLALGACSDCNILSSNMPFHCEAGLVAGMVLLAPIVAPVTILDEIAAGGSS